jgi:hypothetical protein
MKMVTVRDLSMWNMSISMIFNKSPKIGYICGSCDGYSETRISMTAVRLGKPYVVCPYCGEVNDTMLKLS